MIDIYKNGLVKFVINNGGKLKPLIIPPSYTNGTGLMNPSVLIYEDKLLVNIRHINYTLYHSEKDKFHHQYGPLQYLHPENDSTLTTYNYLCQLNDNLTIQTVNKIDTSLLDVKPLWHFIGLEDARLINWNNKLFACGVRRDTTTNGQGRMELSELCINDKTVSEISRTRIPTPNNNDSYCEKNWMPILNKPYHWVKWTNPTQIVKYIPETKNTVTIHEDAEKTIKHIPDLRGGSQVLKYNENRISIVHNTLLFNSTLGRKNGIYRHRFVIWDDNWNIKQITNSFSFMNAKIEFCCGAAFYKNTLLITFGFQDNCAYILEIPITLLDTILENL